MIKDVINLCNENDGFISAILTIVTTVLTIKLSLLPLKNKIKINYFCDEGENEFDYSFKLFIENVGNVPEYINYVEITDDTGVYLYISSDQMKEDERILPPQTVHCFSFDLENVENIRQDLSKNHFNIKINTLKKEYTFKQIWAVG